LAKKQKTRAGLTRRKKKTVKVFISHSHLDASFMTLICDFLKTSELVEDEIRCTSVAGQGLRLGQDVEETLRKEIKKSKIVIGIFTRQSLKSSNVMLELGAGWGFEKVLIPILGPRVGVSALPEWLKQPHSMKWTHRECWEQFEEILREELGKRIKNKKRFDEMIDKLIHWQPDASQR
jgi:hypothetical protein